MAFNVVSTIVNFFKDTLHSFGIESLKDKTTEFVDNNIKVPRLIDNIEGQLNYRYGRETFYNDFCEYINANKSIEKAIRMFYEIKSSGIISKDRFVEDNLNNFRAKYKEYSPYDYSLVKECFALIYEEVFNGIIDVNAHSDDGKLMAAGAMWFGKISETQASYAERISNLEANVALFANASSMPNPVKDDFGPTSEKVENFLKKIESVGNEDNPVSDAESALLRYRELSSEAFVTLRGENEKQIDKVICAINCHMAICYGNLGDIENAFECLKQISPVAAEESKLYQFVKAVLIVNNSLVDKYKEAENCLNRALELDSNHRRAYLVSRYLLVLQGTTSLEEVLSPLEVYFEKVLSENKERELIADYYIYRGFICKEYEAFDLAEKSFVSAREYGYDEVIVDYNLSRCWGQKP